MAWVVSDVWKPNSPEAGNTPLKKLLSGQMLTARAKLLSETLRKIE